MVVFDKDKKTAFQAMEAAQWIAFGPVVFQVARVLRNSGILKLIETSGSEGITIAKIAQEVKLPVYGVRVLLESGLGIGLVVVNNNLYTLTRTGYFILNDRMTKINMDFVHDVCYKGMFVLDKCIETGKPLGLKEFGEWKTLYEGLSLLPEEVQKSWFSFDHFFSDGAFEEVLPLVYKNGIKNLLDIGGNTGKWSIASANYREDIHVTILDLPGQLNLAKNKIKSLGLKDRVSFKAGDMLDENTVVPTGFDAIWMSQFLDCFSEAEIVSILKRCEKAIGDDGFIFIMEPLWDLQQFSVGAFCLQQTSVYFTTIANGNSQMYSSETFFKCITDAGLEIVEQVENIGFCQVLLKCKRKK